MRIDWNQKLEGYPLKTVRDILRAPRYADSPINSQLIAEQLKRLEGGTTRGQAEKARRLLAGLLASDLVVRQSISEGGVYVLTDTGVSLRAARATKRIKRQRAEKAVAAMLEAVQRINSDPIFLHDVAWVAVYGSYLMDESDLGDIDVCVKLDARWKPEASLIGRGKTDRERRVEAFEERYPPPESFYEKGYWRSWPETYTKRLLRTDPAMVIVEPTDLEAMGCPHRLIFPETKNVAAKPGWALERKELVLRPAG